MNICFSFLKDYQNNVIFNVILFNNTLVFLIVML